MPEIRPVSFDKDESSTDQDRVKFAWMEWKKGGRIIEWLQQNRAAAVVMLGYNDPGRLRVIRWCRQNRVPLLVWGDSNVHGDLARGWRAKLKKQVVGRVVEASSALLPCGELGKAFFARYGGDARPNFFVPYEPDYDLITKLPAEFVSQVGRKYELQPGRRRLIFCARMTAQKRPDLMIDSFLAIADRRPEWDLVMVGEGELRSGLMQRVPETSGIADHLDRVHRRSADRERRFTGCRMCWFCPATTSPGRWWSMKRSRRVWRWCARTWLAPLTSSWRGGVNGRLFAPGDLSGMTTSLEDVMDSDRIDAMKRAWRMCLRIGESAGDPVNGSRATALAP